jgi:thiamine biosynthesis protein ThiS
MVAKQGCQPNVSIQIMVNGEAKGVPQGVTVMELLRQLDLDPARVAVELDRRIVRKTQWEDTVLTAGANLEIVQFVGGG